MKCVDNESSKNSAEPEKDGKMGGGSEGEREMSKTGLNGSEGGSGTAASRKSMKQK